LSCKRQFEQLLQNIDCFFLITRLTVFKKNNNFNKRFSEVREALQEKKDL